MKTIIVCSDSHGDTYKIRELLKKHPDAYLYLHAGDSEEIRENLDSFITVKGNNDYYIDNIKSILKVDNNYSIYMTHGHKVLLTKSNMIRIAKENNANIFIHGHTHRPYYEYENGVYMFCPGSLKYPRSTMGETYGLITISDEGQINFEILQY